MELNKITIQATVSADLEKAWDCYTLPEHIINWNFADPSWHCPKAENDMQIGGTYKARMEAKDGSFGFDFEAIYAEITKYNSFSYGLWGREVTVLFNDLGKQTEVTVIFDPENENPIEMQRDGWQAILNNYKKYTEQNH
jgi:uncharacterized protein YndB with AHSA1/START domain